jgi:hypothetical protein
VRNCREISGDLFCIGAIIKKLKPSQLPQPTPGESNGVPAAGTNKRPAATSGTPAEQLQDHIRKAMFK